MSGYLCESCRHMLGEPRTYHYRDSLGIERSVTNAVKIRCDAVKMRAWIEREPAASTADCPTYTRRKEPR